MSLETTPSGRLLKAPENFISPDGVRRVFTEAKEGRRDFIRSAFAAAVAGGATGAALGQANPVPADGGDPHILTLPAHSTGLGQAVVTDGYGKPSKYEANVQRRQSPGLTQTNQASVSFSPLQSLFGIVTPSGLHFERHHQGWWDIDPSKHRLMINGSDDHAAEDAQGLHHGRADAPAQRQPLPLHRMWGQHRHGMGQRRRAHLPVHPRHDQLQRIHRRAAEGVARPVRRRLQARPLRAGRRRRRLEHDAHRADGAGGKRRGLRRLRPERRDAAPGERLPAAPGGAGCAGRELGEVPAPHRGGRQALQRQGRGHPLRRPDARRPAPPVHQHAGMQERDHHALGRAGAAGQGLLPDQRPGLVGQAARSSASTSRSTAAATGRARGCRTR